jgi:thioredoxin-related protein
MFKNMKKFAFAAAVFLLVAAGTVAFSIEKQTVVRSADTLKWYTWEEAAELNKTTPKKIFVDVYTNWCGWCKRMDKTTFADSTVTAYLAANYYPVKLDAEQKADIQFNGHTFKYMEEAKVHELAYSLLDGKLGYPNFVYMTEKYERIMISPGYKEPKDIVKELKFAAEEQYTKTTWEKYRDEN